jgi:hypothetical protein
MDGMDTGAFLLFVEGYLELGNIPASCRFLELSSQYRRSEPGDVFR